VTSRECELPRRKKQPGRGEREKREKEREEREREEREVILRLSLGNHGRCYS